MCHRFGTSPLYFLTEENIVMDPTKLNAPMRNDPSLTCKRAPRLSYVERARPALEEVLAGEEHPPPSVRQIPKPLGVGDTNLRRQFPELCRSISARYLAYRTAHAKETKQQIRDEVRQAVFKVHAQGMIPTEVGWQPSPYPWHNPAPRGPCHVLPDATRAGLGELRQLTQHLSRHICNGRWKHSLAIPAKL